MILNFRFISEMGPGHCVQLPPNLLLAMYDLKKEKRHLITFGAIGVAIFAAGAILITNNIRGICLIALLISCICLGVGLSNKKVKALKIYACIMTEEFDKYIESVMVRLENMLRPELAKVVLVDQRTRNRLTKTLITAQRLKELNEECKKMDDLIESIELVETFCENTFGFIITEEQI